MTRKKILIIGNGAKEFALAKKMSIKHDIYITSLSDTVKNFANSVDIRENNVTELLEFAMENGIDLTIATSCDSICADIATKFAENNQPIFAPCAKAGQIVFDKTLAKKMLYKLRIPTPKFGVFEKNNVALDYAKNNRYPLVIKNNDNNSATVFTSYLNAKNFIDSITLDKENKLIIEDYVYGTPFSFYAITDGCKALPIGSSITYKHALDGNGGQLTSGMGACVPNYQISLEQEYYLMDNIIYPTLDCLERDGTPYTGIIGINGVIEEDGKINILGWQSFFNDCDATAILENIDEDLYFLFESCIVGSFSDEFEFLKFKNSYHATLVLTNKNKLNNENIIQGIDNLDENTIIDYYPSVIKNRYLELEAQYGPVLALTASAATMASAVKKVYEEAREINYSGLAYRKDIGMFCKQ